jgi:hypothetical protein
MKSTPSLPGFGPLLTLIVGAAVVLPQASGQPFPLGSDAWLKQAYGLGVQSYFSGDYQRAYDELTDVVAAGSVDPRVLYFRGLSARKLGRFDEAEADFARGAVQEADNSGDWPVARSLERIQGQDRLALERYRVRSRIARAQARDDDSYSGLRISGESMERTKGPRGGPGSRSRSGADQGGRSDGRSETGDASVFGDPEEIPPGGVSAPVDDPVNESRAEAADGERAEEDSAEKAEDAEMSEDPFPADAAGTAEFEE